MNGSQSGADTDVQKTFTRSNVRKGHAEQDIVGMAVVFADLCVIQTGRLPNPWYTFFGPSHVESILPP
jgi:hypothetical protein